MLECALYAPTGGNLQNSRFLMIQDPRLLEKLNTVIRDELAASAIGRGACWSNQPHWLTDVPAVREIFFRLGLGEDEDIFGSVCVGYPALTASKAPSRKEGRIVLDRELCESMLLK